MMMSAVFWGQLSDKYGRKKVGPLTTHICLIQTFPVNFHVSVL